MPYLEALKVALLLIIPYMLIVVTVGTCLIIPIHLAYTYSSWWGLLELPIIIFLLSISIYLEENK